MHRLVPILFLLFLGKISLADGQNTLISSSKQKESSFEIQQDLLHQRRDAIEFVKLQIAKDGFWKDDISESNTDSVLNVIATCRIKEFTASLISHIDFKLDTKTFKVGANRQDWASSPSLAALIEIGGSEVRTNLLSVLSSTDDPKVRVCSLLTLKLTEGEFANVILEEASRYQTAEPKGKRWIAAKELFPNIENNFAFFARTGKVELVPLTSVVSPLPKVAPSTFFQRHLRNRKVDDVPPAP